MRKITQKWAFLMMTLVCLLGMSQVVTAQTCVEFGEGTSSNNQLPLCGYYHSSYTQQLYLADELEISAGNITSIAFQYTHASSTKREITVYMANTDAESLSSGYVTDAEFTEVLGQSVVEFNNSDDWFTIELETPFAYDGSSNLLVVVYMSYSSAEETSYNGNSRFAYTTATGMARYTTNDYTTSATELTVADGVLTANTNSYTGINGTVSGNRPNIQICYTTGGSTVIPCDKPSGITASDVTAHAATLAWADGSGVYNVEYKKASDAEWTSLLSATTLLTADLTSLEANTAYQAAFRAFVRTIRTTRLVVGRPFLSKLQSVCRLQRTSMQVLRFLPVGFRNPVCWQKSWQVLLRLVPVRVGASALRPVRTLPAVTSIRTCTVRPRNIGLCCRVSRWRQTPS